MMRKPRRWLASASGPSLPSLAVCIAILGLFSKATIAQATDTQGISTILLYALIVLGALAWLMQLSSSTRTAFSFQTKRTETTTVNDIFCHALAKLQHLSAPDTCGNQFVVRHDNRGSGPRIKFTSAMGSIAHAFPSAFTQKWNVDGVPATRPRSSICLRNLATFWRTCCS